MSYARSPVFSATNTVVSTRESSPFGGEASRLIAQSTALGKPSGQLIRHPGALITRGGSLIGRETPLCKQSTPLAGHSTPLITKSTRRLVRHDWRSDSQAWLALPMGPRRGAQTRPSSPAFRFGMAAIEVIAGSGVAEADARSSGGKHMNRTRQYIPMGLPLRLLGERHGAQSGSTRRLDAGALATSHGTTRTDSRRG